MLQGCHLHSLARNLGIITAQHRNSPFEKTGFIFIGCKITGLYGGTVLGRPWGQFSRVIYAHTYMSNTISPEGWHNWDDPSKERWTLYLYSSYNFSFYHQNNVIGYVLFLERCTMENTSVMVQEPIDRGGLDGHMSYLAVSVHPF